MSGCSPDPASSRTRSPSDLAIMGTKKSVQEYYTVLKSADDLKTSAGASCKAPPASLRKVMAQVPAEIKDSFLGCGTPCPSGIEGLRVLDLGSGSGRDCYALASLVGEAGFVTGLDMIPEKLELANKYVESYTRDVLRLQKPNMRFVLGDIEDMRKAQIDDGAYDLIISNCVVNLCPNKPAVLREVFRVLAPNGEMYFSDMYCDRRIAPELKRHPTLINEGLGGSFYIQDFLRSAREAGFVEPRIFDKHEIVIYDSALLELLGNARFYSITFRLFKLPGLLEDASEDYGQVAIYKGTLFDHPNSYKLDDSHTFITGKPTLVCGNTAAIVQNSWLGPHFKVQGDRYTHYGLFTYQ